MTSTSPTGTPERLKGPASPGAFSTTGRLKMAPSSRNAFSLTPIADHYNNPETAKDDVSPIGGAGAMWFEGHITMWKEGQDVAAEYDKMVEEKERMERIGEHARNERSYYAPAGLDTEDYFWNTRMKEKEEYGKNILKFPKVFTENNDGKRSGSPPKMIIPQVAIDDDSEEAVANAHLTMWGSAASLFNTSTTPSSATSTFSSGTTRRAQSVGFAATTHTHSQGSDDYSSNTSRSSVIAELNSLSIIDRFSSGGGSRGSANMKRFSTKTPPPYYKNVLGFAHNAYFQDSNFESGEFEQRGRSATMGGSSRVRGGESRSGSRGGGERANSSHSRSASRGRSRSPSNNNYNYNSSRGGSRQGGRSSRSGTPNRSRSQSRGGTASSSSYAAPFTTYMAGTLHEQFGASLSAPPSKPFDTYDPKQHKEVLRWQTLTEEERKARSGSSVIHRPKAKEDEYEVNTQGLGVTRVHVDEYAIAAKRNHGGKVRSSARTVEERRRWYADEKAEPMYKKIAKVPPFRSKELKDLEEAERKRLQRLKKKEKFDHGADNLSLFDYPGLVRELTEAVDQAKFEESAAAAATATAAVASTTVAAQEPSVSAAAKTEESELPLAIITTDNDEQIDEPKQLHLNRRRPSSAPSTLSDRKPQYNEYYFESLIMASEKPFMRQGQGKVEVEPSYVHPPAISLANVNQVAGPVHFGYDSYGNLVSVVTRSHQAILRPRSASKHPATDRELEGFIRNIKNEETMSTMTMSTRTYGAGNTLTNTAATLSQPAATTITEEDGTTSFPYLLSSGNKSPLSPSCKSRRRFKMGGGDKKNGQEEEIEYAKRTRQRVPFYIVHTPFLDISRTKDVNLYNDKERSPPSPENRRNERKALCELFAITGGENWLRKDNWCSNEPLDKWYGITLDLRGYVCEIKLVWNNLVGLFPTSVGQLKELETLNLDKNHLHGPIGDAALNCLEYLEVLSLRHNKLEGDVPYRVLSLLPNVREVWLSDNLLSGPMHTSIGSITKLTHFCVYKNNVSGCIPESIGKCTYLEVLSLGCNQISGGIPESMKALHRLSHLSLYQNLLTGIVPEWLEELTGLQELNLNFNNFFGFVPKSAKEMFARKKRILARAAKASEDRIAESRESSRLERTLRNSLALERARTPPSSPLGREREALTPVVRPASRMRKMMVFMQGTIDTRTTIYSTRPPPDRSEDDAV